MQISSDALHSDVRLSLQRNISARELKSRLPVAFRLEATQTETHRKVYTTDVVVEEQEFAESKAASAENAGFAPVDKPSPSNAIGDGFMNIPDGIDEELPFNQQEVTIMAYNRDGKSDS